MRSNTSRQVIAVIVIVMSIAMGNSLAARRQAAPDFQAARDETVKILSGFIRVDTSNPPGNETKGAEYLKAILDREGIPSEIFELEQ
jgi:hypothetical protein